MSYKIIAETNGWIASRDIHFNGETSYIVASNISLDEARKKLEELFFEDYPDYMILSDEDLKYYGYEERPDYIASTIKEFSEWDEFENGTARYEFDSRYYSIEEEE